MKLSQFNLFLSVDFNSELSIEPLQVSAIESWIWVDLSINTTYGLSKQ